MIQKNNKNIFILSVIILILIIYKLLPSFYFMVGKHFYKKQNYIKANINFSHAYFFNKKNKDYKFYYVLSLSKLSPTLKVQKTMFNIAYGPDKDSAQQAAMEQINIWQNNITKNIGENYIEQAPIDKGILRWDSAQFPLRIAIIDDSGIEIPQYYKDEIIKAFEQWQASTKFITFATTESERNANIVVKIKPLPDDVCTNKVCKYVVGYTTPNYRGETLHKMEIILYSKDPYGNFFSDKELYNTILHEIGHALGIMGHSYSSEDLMYMATDSTDAFYAPYRSSFQYLSAKDINTIKLLYKLEPTICNASIGKINKKGLIYPPIVLGTSEDINWRKLKEAQNYVKNAPDICGGYIDLGIAYAQLGKYKSAVNALNRGAILAKNQNERYMINYNLAVVYMNSKKFDKALEYAQTAQKIIDSPDIRELILNINHAKRSKTKAYKGDLLEN